jgi:amyloid beta precursor protein binding protein 1
MDKYDRQLRLWGAEGQRRLSAARILCVGSSAVAQESLKNLVLPGVGSICVADDAVAAEEDALSSFFVTADDIGRARAAAVQRALCEMNDDVAGSSMHASASSIAADRAAVAAQSIVVAAQLSQDDAAALSRVCREAGVPLIVRRRGPPCEPAHFRS